MRNKLLKLLQRDKRKMTMKQLSAALRMPAPTLVKLLRGERVGNITTWERIAKYYRRKDGRNT